MCTHEQLIELFFKDLFANSHNSSINSIDVIIGKAEVQGKTMLLWESKGWVMFLSLLDLSQV